jgi:hypothetical protein
MKLGEHLQQTRQQLGQVNLALVLHNLGPLIMLEGIGTMGLMLV